MPRAVLFDLDNTLIDRDQAFLACLNAATADPDARAELRRLDHGGRGDRAALFAAWARHTGEVMDQLHLSRLMSDRLQPDAALLEELRTLGTRCKAGIISNGGGEVQRQKLRASGLASVIPDNQIWISGEVGCAKPNPAIFLLASRTLDIAPEHCLFVGDHENDDIAGARGVGMRARRVEQPLDGPRLRELLQEER
jgi:HAD superfamily hydrolase (TIGR01493 family)